MKLILSIFSILFLLAGCNNEDVFLPDLKGNIVGYAYALDEFANPLDDHSNINVTALGVQKAYQTLTDASGRFEMKNLPAGTYEFIFEKAGFGTMKQFGIQHLGGTPTILGLRDDSQLGVYRNAIFIYQLSLVEILNLSIENDTLTGEFEFAGSAPENIGLLVYFSTNPNFSLEQASYTQNLSLTFDGEEYQCHLNTDPGYFPFYKGETIYYKASVHSTLSSFRMSDHLRIYGIDNYFDEKTNTIINPNLGNESAEFSFILQE